jgi:DNA-binding MarR family transcriptional regulator
VSSQKRRLFHELLEEVRLSQLATDRFDQAVADALGLNRSDMRCLDVIDREGPVTAGRLAETTGLTTGAITTVLDRLEGRGLARRVRDESDRRRVLVEMTPEGRQGANEYYGSHMELSEALYDRYTAEQMELLLGFIRAGRTFNEREAARLEARTRGARASGPRTASGGGSG